MKKHILIIGALLLGYTNFSCSSDDNEDNQTIEGTYELTSITSSKLLDLNANGSFDANELTDHITCDSKIVLNEDGTFVISNFTIYQSGGNYSELYGPVDCSPQTFNGTYSINDGSLIINYINYYDESVNEILEINNGTIKSKLQESFYTNENNSISMESIEITVTYKK